MVGSSPSLPSGKHLGAGLSELHIGPAFVHPQKATGYGEFHARGVFGRLTAMFVKERPVDFLDVNPAVLNRLDRVGKL